MTSTKIRFGAVGLIVGAAALCAAGPAAFAQGGATGGVIGKQNKAVSGEAPAVRGGGAPAVAPRPRAAPAACPNLTGVWSSWASGMFGKSDTTFNADGTCHHRSGFHGRWWCDNGRLHIAWPDGKPGEVKMSADGRTIYGLDGGVHMRR